MCVRTDNASPQRSPTRSPGRSPIRSPLHPDGLDMSLDGTGTADLPINEEGGGGSGEEGGTWEEDEEQGMRFTDEDVEEARKMIERLIERTELALNKHHNAKISMIAQENKALAEAIALNSSAVALGGEDFIGAITVYRYIYCVYRYIAYIPYIQNSVAITGRYSCLT